MTDTPDPGRAPDHRAAPALTAGTPGAEVAETHAAVVFFVGDRAYKVKKPVDLGFLDFTDRQQRERACHREVALNRRLAPDVYLGVADVYGPDGDVCDHLVVMRRLPAQRRLATLVRDDAADVADQVRRVARVVAAFHAEARRPADADVVGGAATLRRNWDDNLDVLRRADPDVVGSAVTAEIERGVTRWLDGRGPLLQQRIESGRIRDGHGDLLADDIFCLDDGPRVLDCIEFAESYRVGDVLLDAAFLAMDLERLGRPDLGRRFLDWYGEFSGEQVPASLAHFFIAYRASVRAKVGVLRREQGGADTTAAVQRLVGICGDHLRRAAVRLVLVGGLPGTGKSTLAAGLADHLDLALLRTDEIRKDLVGVSHDRPAGGDAYTAEARDAVYREMLDRAERLLSMGQSVVCDATWTSAGHRDAAHRVAGAASADVVGLRCEVGLDVAAERIRRRVREGTDASDASVDVLRMLEGDRDPWPAAVTIDTSGSPEASVEAAVRAVRPAGD